MPIREHSPTHLDAQKTLSAESDGCRVQSPAEGLRGSSLGATPDVVSHVRASLDDEPSSGEHHHGSAGLRQAEDDALEGRREAVAPFLVLEGRLEPRHDAVGWSLREDPCPLTGYLAVDRSTGEVAWNATCNSARCFRCSRVVSARTFAMARRSLEDLPAGSRVRFITLTLAPERWEEVRHRMKMLARYFRRRGITVQWLWVVEEGERNGMKHVHAVQWGPEKIPWEDLLGVWGHRVQIESAHAAMGYLGKNVVRYLGKGLDGDRSSIEAHMNLNGGRAAHWSRGFFAGESREGFARSHRLPGTFWLDRHWVEGQR